MTNTLLVSSLYVASLERIMRYEGSNGGRGIGINLEEFVVAHEGHARSLTNWRDELDLFHSRLACITPFPALGYNVIKSHFPMLKIGSIGSEQVRVRVSPHPLSDIGGDFCQVSILVIQVSVGHSGNSNSHRLVVVWPFS